MFKQMIEFITGHGYSLTVKFVGKQILEHNSKFQSVMTRVVIMDY